MKIPIRLIGPLCAAILSAVPLSVAADYVERPEVREFIADMAARHGFEPAVLETLFAEVQQQEAVLRAITPKPVGVRSWQTYRNNFVNTTRIEEGVQFWQAHSAELERAEAQYGVPAEIIVAIIGVETLYGRRTGSFRVLDALTTLAFDYPRRADYFRSELEQLLLYARESNRPPGDLYGSYAGAIGIPQFMPGSIRRFAVDFDGDGQRDLSGSVADAVGSVASFLVMHGWRPGEAIATPAYLTDQRATELIDGGVLPDRPAGALRAAGVHFDANIPDDAEAVLIELDSVDAPSKYLVGLQNFYVITRYNRSSFYATAVWELAEAIRNARSL